MELITNFFNSGWFPLTWAVVGLCIVMAGTYFGAREAEQGMVIGSWFVGACWPLALAFAIVGTPLMVIAILGERAGERREERRKELYEAEDRARERLRHQWDTENPGRHRENPFSLRNYTFKHPEP